MVDKKINFIIIESIVKSHPNDCELGREIRKYIKNISESEIDNSNIEKYIRTIETEIVMSNYNDGWLTEWYKKKLKEIKSKIKKNKK